jgi:NAD(P)-dependent dehydrogenase (short-subunit alcohol dehydrogenase family)
MTKPLANRIAVVTGASRGIGYATARALAREGAHVVAVARTVGGLEELDDAIKADGGTATLVPLDITDHDGMARLGGALFDRHGKIDILVGNAGVYGVMSPISHVEPKVWDQVISANVTANYHLIRSMEPLLLKSDAGRAVFVTSGAGWRALAYRGPYATSKAALDALIRVWSEEMKSTPVRVNLFSPGPIRTHMRAQAAPGEDPMTLDTPEQCVEFLVPMCRPDFTETGKAYSYPDRKLLAFNMPS